MSAAAVRAAQSDFARLSAIAEAAIHNARFAIASSRFLRFHDPLIAAAYDACKAREQARKNLALISP